MDEKISNRRWKGGIVATVLMTVGFFYTSLRGIDIMWFSKYSMAIVVIYGLACLGWTATDILGMIIGGKK